MGVDSIAIGNRVEITLQLDENSSSKIYVSKVVDCENVKEMMLQVPISSGQSVKLPKSSRYTMYFFTDDGMFRFKAAIIGYKKIDDVRHLVVEVLDEGEKVQRREFFRYGCFMPIQFYKYGSDNNILREDLYNGETLDLGGGGIKFLSNAEMEVYDNIQCVLIIQDEFLFLNAHILYKDEARSINYRFQYRVVFTDILDSERDAIIQYVFNEQRSKIRNKVRKVDE